MCNMAGKIVFLTLVLLFTTACFAAIPETKACNEDVAPEEAYLQGGYWVAKGDFTASRVCYRRAKESSVESIVQNAEFMHSFLKGMSKETEFPAGITMPAGGELNFGSGWNFIGRKLGEDGNFYEIYVNDYGDSFLHIHSFLSAIPVWNAAYEMEEATGIRFYTREKGGNTVFISMVYSIAPGVRARTRAWNDDTGSHVLQSSFGIGRGPDEDKAANKAIGGGLSILLIGGFFLVVALGSIIFYFKKGHAHFKKGSKIEKKISKKEEKKKEPKKEVKK